MTQLLHLAAQGVEATPIVFLHGVASSGRFFASRCAKLGERHNLLLPDLLGFGFSPRPANNLYDSVAHAEALHKTLQAKAGSQLGEGLVLVGHSWGGLVALTYAVCYPQYVRQLILFNPPLYWSPEKARDCLIKSSAMTRFILVHPRLAQTACVTLCSTGTLTHIGPYLLRRLPRDVAADAGRHSWASLSRTILNSIINYDLGYYLGQIKACGIPLTVIFGQYDNLSYPEQVARFQAEVPHAQTLNLAINHQPFFGKADLCVEIIQNELQRVARYGYRKD
jgi:pimeloyl-ACP methyl ester carboxylesterase